MSSTLDWANLFEEEAPRLLRFLRRFGPRVSAEDIAQDAFTRLAASKAEDIASPRAYLTVTAATWPSTISAARRTRRPTLMPTSRPSPRPTPPIPKPS
jgi:DNA-directed RNA polymerase specialized sigma24 family protein